MNALTTLAMYSDSSEDQDEEMSDNSQHNGNRNTNFNSDTDSELMDITTTQIRIPSMPLSPNIKPQSHQQENIANLMKQFKNNEKYFESRFRNSNFLDNPKFTANTLQKLNLFNYDDDKINKLDEYSSALSLKIFNPINYLDEEDSVDTLMKLLEEKIRENQRKIQEKRERKEKQKQLREKNEKRIAMPKHNINSQHTHQQKYILINNNCNVLHAAKQAVLAKKNEFIANSKRKKEDNKKSRWDEK